MAFRIQPPPTGTLYSVLQKAKPGWSTKDLLKVYQKLQKVSIKDGESLARAVSEGSLNAILSEAGERKLKTSTLQLLRLASRDVRCSSPAPEEESAAPAAHCGARDCFCGTCIRLPLCQRASRDVLSMKLPSIKSLGPPPLMPSRFRGTRAPRRGAVVAPLPRVKSEPSMKLEPRSRLFSNFDGSKKLHSPAPPMPLEMPKKVLLSPTLATVPERPRQCLPQRIVEEPDPQAEASQHGALPGVIHSASTSSFHSYATFVEKQGQEEEIQHIEAEAYSSQESYAMTFEGQEEEIPHIEADAYSSQESYAMTFEGSSLPSRSRVSSRGWGAEHVTEHAEQRWSEDSDEDGQAEATMDLGARGLDDTMEALKELVEADTTLPRSRDSRNLLAAHSKSPAASDHCQQIAAARRKQQRRRMIRAYG